LPLLSQWVNGGEGAHLRDALIVLLLHNGPRLSEVLHMFVHDVISDSLRAGSALVKIYHPEEGLAPDDWYGDDGRPIATDRQNYLRGKYGLRPRTQYRPNTAMHLGWKGATFDSRKSKHYRVWFFPREHGEVFWRLWPLYLVHRHKTMAEFRTSHPFAFVNRHGNPLGVDSFKQIHKRAMKRLGVDASWESGTTPHCHRHAYAQRLRRAGLDATWRQKLLHHASVRSQESYSVPTDHEVSDALNQAILALGNVELAGYGRVLELSSPTITGKSLPNRSRS
jgi:hypothetical protein